jgi:hypothetical protein
MLHESSTAPRRLTAYGPHRKPLHHDNVLAGSSPEALLLLRRHGAELVVAEGSVIRAFALSETDDHVHTKPTWKVQLPGRPIAIADVVVGVLVTWLTQDYTTVALIRDGIEDAVVIMTLTGHVTALAGAPGVALLAVRPTNSSAGRLLRIDVSRGVILAGDLAECCIGTSSCLYTTNSPSFQARRYRSVLSPRPLLLQLVFLGQKMRV